jgi:hypothetical protein
LDCCAVLFDRFLITQAKEKTMKYLQVKGANIPALGFGTFMIAGAECTAIVRYGY